jgi:alcohol dehydrogenase
MKQFSFQLPTRIEFGNGVSATVGEEAKGLGGSRALVVTDPGVVSAGLLDPVLASLKTAGIATTVFDEIAPNPRETSVAHGAELAVSEQCDVLVALGGGSPMDIAKAIGLIQQEGGRIADYEGLDRVRKPITPLIAIPTTAGTGSEVTFWSVIMDSARSFKMSIGSPLIAARVALVDPAVTVGLPAALTAATGMDALAHAIEAYTATLSEPLTDSLALSAIRLVGKSLRQAYANGGNLPARYDMMLASLLGTVASGNSDVGGAHCMSEAVGGHYDIPHGLATAVYLPVVMDFNCIAVPEKYAAIVEALGENTCGLSLADAAKAAGSAVRKLSNDLGIPTASGLGVRAEDFPRLAKAASVNVSVESNCRIAGEQDFLQMFEAAGGSRA